MVLARDASVDRSAVELHRYHVEWVTVKLRWRLTVDTSEKAGLTRAADSCPDVTITFTHPESTCGRPNRPVRRIVP